MDEPVLPHPAASDERDAPRSIDELKQRIATVMAREHVPGVAIALVDRDGPIWVGGIGVADVESGAPMTADTAFRVGSLTKSVLVLGIMRLVEQGKLDLDAPLHLPGVAMENAWNDVAPITLARLLEHTSGFEDLRLDECFTDVDDLSTADALAINPRSRVVHWRPGTRHSYSNAGFSVAARALELAAGEPFDTYLQREVLHPIGIDDADFRRTPAVAARLATGYIEPDRPARFTPIAHRAAGAMLASASDLGKLVQLYLRHGEGVVSAASMARIETSATLPYPTTGVAYGFANYGEVAFAVPGRGHNGGMPGFSSELRYFPSIGRGYVILANSTYDGTWLVQAEIRRDVFAFLARDRISTTTSSARVEPPGASFYAHAAPTRELLGFLDRAMVGWDVATDGDGVRLDPVRGNWHAADLEPAGDGGYRFHGDSGSFVRFTTNPDGHPIMLLGNVYTEAGDATAAHARVAGLRAAAWLLFFAPVWSVLAIALAWLRRRRAASDLLIWNAVAGLAFAAMPRLFVGALLIDVAGTVHPLTDALCAATVVFAVASAAALFCALRWMVRADRPPLLGRIVPSATAVASFALAVWLALNGVIGIRLWLH